MADGWQTYKLAIRPPGFIGSVSTSRRYCCLITAVHDAIVPDSALRFYHPQAAPQSRRPRKSGGRPSTHYANPALAAAYPERIPLATHTKITAIWQYRPTISPVASRIKHESARAIDREAATWATAREIDGDRRRCLRSACGDIGPGRRQAEYTHPSARPSGRHLEHLLPAEHENWLRLACTAARTFRKRWESMGD